MVVSCNNGTLSTFVPTDDNQWDISKVLLVKNRCHKLSATTKRTSSLKGRSKAKTYFLNFIRRALERSCNRLSNALSNI